MRLALCRSSIRMIKGDLRKLSIGKGIAITPIMRRLNIGMNVSPIDVRGTVSGVRRRVGS